MEASALNQAAVPALAGRSPLLRLQSDERLVALVRRGHHGAFEAFVQRYQPRLLAFCRHMLGSREDAEDVLQEVFTAAYNALLADDRPINARPWLYRIARNRCLNHLRKPRATGQDSMDIFERDNGATTAETVHRREEFRQIVSDVGDLPETQRTALLLREIDALSYDQIAEAMDTTVPSVKSLLVRARVNLAEAAEARLLTCAEVRLELAQVAEGLGRLSAPARRHVKGCPRCRTFRSELRATTRALAAVYPIGPLVILKKLGLAKLGFGGAAAGSAAGGSGIAGSAGVAAGGAGAAAAGGAASGAIGAGVGTLASKAAAGMAAAVIVTAGAVEVKEVTGHHAPPRAAVAAAPPAPVQTPRVVEPEVKAPTPVKKKAAAKPKSKSKPKPLLAAAPPQDPAPVEKPMPPAPAPAPQTQAVVQEEQSTSTLPPRTQSEPTPPATQTPTTPPGESVITPPQLPPAPAAGEPRPTQGPPPLLPPK